MITASHNPKDDNGYKLYGSNGAQIVSPVDADVQACILQSLDVTAWDESAAAGGHPLVHNLAAPDVDLPGRYQTELRAALTFQPQPAPAGPAPTIVYTAMHGVGTPHVLRGAKPRAVGAKGAAQCTAFT